jgi:acyl-CoA dehydrogenase
VVHFHGNGEVVADWQGGFEDFIGQLGWDLLLAEYRGYGASTGEPQLGRMLDDVKPILCAAGPPGKLVAFGRSVGSIFALEAVGSGSDPAAMHTRATQDGDSFILNGTKRFITGAGRADYAQVMAVTDPEKRARGGITCLAVDMKSPGVILERQWPTMMGEAPWQIVFDNVHVPAANVIGNIGGGFSLAQKWIQEGRIRGHGARPVGIARRALDMMIDYSQHRVTFGRPLADRQAIQFMIADSAMELHATRLMVYECAWRHDRGDDVRNLSYMVKVMSTEMAGRVVDKAIQVHGGVGLTKDLPLEWWYRQIRSTRITEGANEVLRWRLGQNLIRAHG